MKKAMVSLVVLLALLASCGGRHERARAVYYWQTTLRLDTTERDFLERHNIKKVYCRYFDVVIGDNGQPHPNATLAFDDSFPKEVEAVPVVYILNDCMRQRNDSLAEMIFHRVAQMNEANGVANVGELQIDCDWSQGTRRTFFNFMATMLGLCHDHGMRLSATIRLHQLSQEPPPADYGVLMFYNTGDVSKLSVSKPILDIKDVAPYLKYLRTYKLPLSAAYPLFTWRVLFRGGRYVGIMHGDDDLPVLPGDSVAVRQPSINDILNAKAAVEKARGDTNDEIILFDLNDNNIKRFRHEDFELIYNKP